MPQFQIRRHPHGGTWQVFYLNEVKPRKSWYEANSVQECLVRIMEYINVNSFRNRCLLEVLPG